MQPTRQEDLEKEEISFVRKLEGQKIQALEAALIDANGVSNIHVTCF